MALCCKRWKKIASFLFFQRVVTLKEAKTVYFESLMRILENEEFHLPLPYISVAKKRGLYHKLNFLMIKKSLQAAAKLGVKISINIDLYDILQERFITDLKELFASLAIDPKRVQFEILETQDFYEHLESVKLFIATFKEMGCTIALDDFGKGYSNFDALKTLDIDLLKIDISLVKNIDKDDKSRKLLRFIAEFSKGLQLESTAEGVANEKIYSILKEFAIDYIQGYYIQKPQPIEKIEL